MLQPNEINYDSQYIIAQDDDEDWEESGWVALVFNDHEAALSQYSHCSCYGTFGIGGAIESWDWTGTPDQLVELAKNKRDPNMPEREADPKDYDYDHLMSVYQQILNWDKGERQCAKSD